MSEKIIKDVAGDSAAQLVAEGIKSVAEEVVATVQIIEENKNKIKQEKKAVLVEYHKLLVELIKCCEEDKTEVGEADGVSFDMDVTDIVAEDISEAGYKAVDYYQQHKAELDNKKLEKYSVKIGEFMENRKDGSLVGNEDFLETVKKAKDVLVKLLQ